MVPYFYYSSAGVIITGIVYFLIKLLKDSITEEVKLSLKHEYDERIEKFKGDIKSNQDILNNILSTSSSNYHVYQTQRIEAIKILWNNYLLIREFISMVRALDSFILIEEFDSLYKIKHLGIQTTEKQIESIDLASLKNLSEYQDTIELVRPYLNETIWIKILFLVRFVGRIQLLYKNGAVSKNFQHFTHDSSLKDLLKNNLKPKEFEYVYSLKYNIINSVQSFIEQDILFNIKEILKGSEHTEDTFSKANALSKLIATKK